MRADDPDREHDGFRALGKHRHAGRYRKQLLAVAPRALREDQHGVTSLQKADRPADRLGVPLAPPHRKRIEAADEGAQYRHPEKLLFSHEAQGAGRSAADDRRVEKAHVVRGHDQRPFERHALGPDHP
jgi:hypothetical protein